MSRERPGIMVYFDDVLPSIQCLSLEDAGRLFIAMLQYGRDGIAPDFGDSAGLNIAWNFIRPKIDRDNANYDRAVLKSRYGVYKREASKRNEALLDFDEWCQMLEDTSSTNVSPLSPIMGTYPTGTATSNKQPQMELQPELVTGKVSVELEIGATPPAICLPLNDGTEYQVSQEQCQEWAGLYPAVDVIQQLRNMKGWLDGNPAKKKTRRGIARFINGWLSREQDRGGSSGSCQNSTGMPQSRKSWAELARELEGGGRL